MKQVFTFLAAVLLTATVWAQSPEKMSYQAVIRNSSEALVTNTTVGMQISILQGSASGTAVYVETQSPTTNANGLVSLEIGVGTVVSGDFTTIDWANGTYFIKTETDPAGGTSYTIAGVSQLLSVPYALHAKTAETVTGGITETDPTYTSSQAANITATDITNLGNLSGVNTGDQDLSALATKTALGDSTAQVRSEIPDVSGFLTSYTETDPTYTSSEVANITATDITNLGNLSGVNTGDQDLSALATKTALGDSTAQVRSEIPDVSGFLTSYTETDPTYTSSEAANITATDITNLGNLSGVNTGDQDGSETKVTAGTNVTITGAGTTASPYVINSTASGSGTHYLGEEYLGGIIFNLYTTSDGTQHGLIVSKTETVATWGSTLVGADRTEDGAFNTNLMPTGAGTARTWVETLGAGWYLPSIDELSILWHNRYYVNKTARAVSSTLLSHSKYWSSTEYNAIYAFSFYFNFGDASYDDKSNTYSVRAVRAF
jgi:hypothetical protein